MSITTIVQGVDNAARNKIIASAIEKKTFQVVYISCSKPTADPVLFSVTVEADSAQGLADFASTLAGLDGPPAPDTGPRAGSHARNQDANWADVTKVLSVCTIVSGLGIGLGYFL